MTRVNGRLRVARTRRAWLIPSVRWEAMVRGISIGSIGEAARKHRAYQRPSRASILEGWCIVAITRDAS